MQPVCGRYWRMDKQVLGRHTLCTVHQQQLGHRPYWRRESTRKLDSFLGTHIQNSRTTCMFLCCGIQSDSRYLP
jgi:hypothetical protein